MPASGSEGGIGEGLPITNWPLPSKSSGSQRLVKETVLVFFQEPGGSFFQYPSGQGYLKVLYLRTYLAYDAQLVFFLYMSYSEKIYNSELLIISQFTTQSYGESCLTLYILKESL